MKIAIHQPQYMPWVGYIDKMMQADVFVLLDDVQYKKNEWQNRNKIRTFDSWQWITVPVEYEFGQKIKEVHIDKRSKWNVKHCKSLYLNYAKAPFFKKYFPSIEELLLGDWEKLSDLNIKLILKLREMMGVETKILLSSDMKIESHSTERLIDICKELNADTYLSGEGGKGYLNPVFFKDNDIKLEYQKYEHPVYTQVYEGFSPYMAIVDLLFCKGPETIDKIKEGRR